MNSEVHVLHRVHNDVDELHAGHLGNKNNYSQTVLIMITVEPSKYVLINFVEQHGSMMTAWVPVQNMTFTETVGKYHHHPH